MTDNAAEPPEYIPVEEVAALLSVTTRHAHKACHKGNVRQRQAGKRMVYHRADVARLADELGAAYRTPEAEPSPASATDVIRPRDLQQTFEQLAAMAHENGKLEAERDQAREEAKRLRAELDAARAIIAEHERTRQQATEEELEQLRASQAAQQAAAPQQESQRRQWWRLWRR